MPRAGIQCDIHCLLCDRFDAQLAETKVCDANGPVDEAGGSARSRYVSTRSPTAMVAALLTVGIPVCFWYDDFSPLTLNIVRDGAQPACGPPGDNPNPVDTTEQHLEVRNVFMISVLMLYTDTARCTGQIMALTIRWRHSLHCGGRITPIAKSGHSVTTDADGQCCTHAAARDKNCQETPFWRHRNGAA